MRNIIIDCDPGHDDVIAILTAIAHKEEFNREKIGDINMAFNIGEEKKNNFISLFKQENKHMTNIIEALLADYIIQEEK